MKHNIFTAILLFCLISLQAQNRPEAYMSMMPDIPGPICDHHNEGTGHFYTEIQNVDIKLTAELNRRRENMDASVNSNQSKIEAHAMQQSGVSPELTQKMMALQQQKKNAKTEQQRKEVDKQMKALTDQMMQESANISMGEVQNLKKMDKEGKTAWATAYSTEKKAEVMAEPEKYQEQNAKNMQKFNLQQQYSRLNDSLGAAQGKYAKKFQEMEENEVGKNLLELIGNTRKEMNDYIAMCTEKDIEQDKGKIDGYKDQINMACESYCQLLGPRYAENVETYKNFILTALSSYYRLEDLNNKVMAMQTGVDLKPEPGYLGLDVVKDYLSRLKDAFRYNIIGREGFPDYKDSEGIGGE